MLFKVNLLIMLSYVHKDWLPLVFGLFKHYSTFFLVNMDSKWLNKL